MTKAESDQINYWYESGMDFIDGLRQRSKHYTFFKAQFGEAIALGAFSGVTPAVFIDALKRSDAFWAWWDIDFADEIMWLLIPNDIMYDVANTINNNKNDRSENRKRTQGAINSAKNTTKKASKKTAVA